MPEQNAEFQRKLDEVHRAYVQRLPTRLTEIQDGWSAVSHGQDTDALTPLHRAVHSLIGSAGTFGHDHLSGVARRFERLLKPLRDQCSTPTAEQCTLGETLLGELRQAVQSVTGPEPLDETPFERSALDEVQPDTATLYLLGSDHKLESELGSRLPRFGYRLIRTTSVADLRKAMAVRPAAAIIASLSTPQAIEEPASIREALGSELMAKVPLLFVAAQDDLELRLASVQAGAQMFYPKPVDIRALVSRLDALTQRHHPEPYRVLLVDDEPELAQHYALVLTQAGMQTEVVAHWQELMPALARFRPEMIIMDIYMPEYSGLDLATVIRQDERYIATPILFLSSETDEAKQLVALGLGADGFLTKPVSDPHLINTVAVRMQRSRLLSAAVSRDALTGLLNHARIKEILETELARIERHGGQLAFAMLDIDHFKRINDSRGHMLGDQVIVRLARLLQERMRRGDAVGRYGGEEFAVILPHTGLDDACRVIDELREHFGAMSHGSDNDSFTATLSAGVASSADYPDIEDLIRAADRALYDAKEAGRNRVLSAAR